MQFAQKESVQEKNIIERRVERMREENKRLVEPQRLQFEREIAGLEEDLAAKKADTAAENGKCEELGQQIEDTKAKNSALLQEEEKLNKLLTKVRGWVGG